MSARALADGTADWGRFAALYRDEAPRLTVFALTLGAARVGAADLAHDSLAALWRRWDDVPGAPRTFARVLAVRAAERGDGRDVDGDGGAPADGGLPAGPAARHGAFLTELHRLPVRHQQVAVAIFDDLAPEDIAQVLRMRVDDVAGAVEAGLTSLDDGLGGTAQEAYEALVADVADALDLEAGLVRIDDKAAAVAPVPSAGARRPPTAAVPDELVAAAADGDRAAVAKLLELLRPLVARYCRGTLGPVNRSFLSADDVAQEVCLAVLNALPNYRPQGSPFLAFVYGIAAHKVIDAHRSVTRARADPVEVVPDAVETGPGPEQHALRGVLTAQLRALLDELPDKQREILVLRIVVGLSAEETARVVGATPGTVRVAQHRAHARLRKILRERGADPS